MTQDETRTGANTSDMERHVDLIWKACLGYVEPPDIVDVLQIELHTTVRDDGLDAPSTEGEGDTVADVKREKKLIDETKARVLTGTLLRRAFPRVAPRERARALERAERDAASHAAERGLQEGRVCSDVTRRLEVLEKACRRPSSLPHTRT